MLKCGEQAACHRDIAHIRIGDQSADAYGLRCGRPQCKPGKRFLPQNMAVKTPYVRETSSFGLLYDFDFARNLHIALEGDAKFHGFCQSVAPGDLL